MSYASGEALILTQIQSTDGFNSRNAVRGIYAVLNSGAAKSYAILRPSSFTNEQTGFGAALGASHKAQYTVTWTTVCELYVHLRDYGSSLDELADRRQEIIDRFNAYPQAGDTTSAIEDCSVISAGDVYEIANQGTPVFLKQELVIQWKENTYVTIQE